MTAEVCPGQILTIYSTLRGPNADDEYSWTNWFLRNIVMIVLGSGLIGTAIYQYLLHA